MTAILKQLEECRAANPGMLILFENGDFYELFGGDALVGAKALNLTITRRDGLPMAGFPLIRLEQNLRKLLAAGHRVAVAELSKS